MLQVNATRKSTYTIKVTPKIHLNADRDTMTGVTSDGRMVEWVRCMNCWVDESNNKVTINSLTWIELDVE